MAIRRKHSSRFSMYYITFTCYQWLPLFEITQGYDLVYKWFNYLQVQKSVQVVAYVIMPNHIHVMLYFPEEDFDLNKIIGNAKRFLAYEIVKRLQTQNNQLLLQKLSSGVSIPEKKKGQQHKVFEPSFDAKPVYSQYFFFQKLVYIHHNPVSGKWNLTDDFSRYEHSSASFYELQQVKHFRPVHYQDL